MASHLARILTQLSIGKGNYNILSPLQEEDSPEAVAKVFLMSPN